MADKPFLLLITLWEPRFESFLYTCLQAADAAHDLAHIRRVVTSAKRLAHAEGAALEIVVPAAWLHDCVIVAKDDPRRKEASRLAAQTAVTFLRSVEYPEAHLSPIAHAIAAHSFSANIPPETLEARVVQDADRLDALGAIGLSRCLLTGGALGRPLYDPDDPFAEHRPADDAQFTIDHFYTKLLRLPATMQTEAGRQEAQTRVTFMTHYLDVLRHEIEA